MSGSVNPFMPGHLIDDCRLDLSYFLEVDLQRSTYIHFAFVVLHSRGGGGGGGVLGAG